jgi:glycosyl transferase, family 25
MKTRISGRISLRCYLLTLYESSRDDIDEKLEILSKSLGKAELFYGLDGRKLSSSEYFLKLVSGFSIHNKILSPGEIGCASSHVSIIQSFLLSGDQLAVIFEDDVLILDYSLDLLKRNLSLVEPNDVLVAGCQQGLAFGPIFGSALYEGAECYSVHRDCWTSIKRGCAYVVGRQAGEHILRVQAKGLYVADDFSVLCPPDGRLLFCNAFGHPLSLQDSTLEEGRRMLPSRDSLLLRLGDEIRGAYSRRMVRARNLCRRVLGNYEVLNR